jgi:hypothetical protein
MVSAMMVSLGSKPPVMRLSSERASRKYSHLATSPVRLEFKFVHIFGIHGALGARAIICTKIPGGGTAASALPMLAKGLTTTGGR